MKYSHIQGDQYLLRLEKGEKIIESLKSFCEKNEIKNAWISGLGSCMNPILAYYKVAEKEFVEKKLEGDYEVLNITGNIALFEEKPLPHLHISLSDHDMKGLGGHLVEGTVGATMEVHITKLNSTLIKAFDEEIGLKLFQLENKF